MQLSNYYYHTILKDSLSLEDIYKNFELILKDGYIKSKKLLLESQNKNTYNGDEYISIASYEEQSPYKVTPLDEPSFSNSSLSNIYSTYNEYLTSLQEYEYTEEPLSKAEYFSKFNTTNKREYFNYLDNITKTYPVDIKYLFESTKDPIYKEILKEIDKEILYCYPSENAYQKFVLESNGITFIFPKTISIVPVTIIPNLPFEIENKLVETLSTLNNRYSNLIGELQVQDKLNIKDAIGVIIRNNVDEKLIKELFQKYNYNLKIYTIENNKLTEKIQSYYHVVTVKPMYVGQKIIFDETNHSGVYTRVMEQLPLVEDIYNNPTKYKQEDLDHHTKVALRELAMEEVRKENYSNYPSRLSSLYVSTNLEDSKMWAKSFISKGRDVYQIVKIKTTGNVFTGNAYNCFEGTTTKEENIKKSHAYWQKDNSNAENILYETIIDGEIEVIEIIEEFK